MTDIIEANFSQIKDILQGHKEEIKKIVTQQKDKEIEKLQNDIKAKDTQIFNLSKKEGELKGKDDMIATLNKNIENLQS